VNFFIEAPDGSSRLAGADYFWFFTALMLATALGFIWHSRTYQEKTYLQDAA
jgi:POT family proton-dependent oligopeptide transporter